MIPEYEAIRPERHKRRRQSIGLLNMNGEQHKQQRRLMQPVFHRKQVEGYRDEMVGLTQQMLAEWRAGHHLDIAHAM